MKKVISVLLSFILVMGIPTFAADQDIVDIAAGIEDFSILVAALQKADLVGALQGEGPFTVFAPTNAAFEQLLSDLGITAQDFLNHPQLADVLLYHVVAGQVLSTDLSDGMMPATLSGETIKVDLSSGVSINASKVTSLDVLAKNGVIHIIDAVLVPPTFALSQEPKTVVDIALSSDDFSILVSLLQKADLVGALQGEGPFTVFAPTNAAFEAALKALNVSASDLMNQPDLSKILLYHVVSGKVMSTDLSNGLQAPTLNGESLVFDLSSGVNVNKSAVIAADLVAGNGVVHVVDAVLIPENFVYQDVAQITALPKTGTLSLTPFAIVGIISLAGATLYKKRME